MAEESVFGQEGQGASAGAVTEAGTKAVAGTSGQTAPAFDPEALRASIAEDMKAEFERRVQENAELQREIAQPEGDAALTRVLAPVVGPALSHINVTAQGAVDAALFYSADADDAALRRKWGSEIEAKFNELVRSGRPTPRGDILNWMIGGGKRTEYIDWEVKRREQKQRDAEMAESAGGGSSRMGRPAKALADMTEEEMVKALEGGF